MKKVLPILFILTMLTACNEYIPDEDYAKADEGAQTDVSAMVQIDRVEQKVVKTSAKSLIVDSSKVSMNNITSINLELENGAKVALSIVNERNEAFVSYMDSGEIFISEKVDLQSVENGEIKDCELYAKSGESVLITLEYEISGILEATKFDVDEIFSNMSEQESIYNRTSTSGCNIHGVCCDPYNYYCCNFNDCGCAMDAYNAMEHQWLFCAALGGGVWCNYFLNARNYWWDKVTHWCN
ncbi:MAG: hypothetical protein SVZ03_13650 [Spirochaetota bacterium]|nr:hypothetical protein [Spirochaetota bacterium]